jgi:MFS family permease
MKASHKQLLLIDLASVIIMMGVQFILPVLPVMQQSLGLNDSEIALVTSAYLLPSIVFALVSGLLADRFGRKQVYSVAMVVFGIAGSAVALTSSLELILILRFIQGSAFAAVHPLSITLIGDMLTGARQVAVQGQRVVVLSLGDAILPVLGGILVVFGWHFPFALQAAAIPVGIAVWFILPQGTITRNSTALHLKELGKTMRLPAAMSLQIAGFLRMFFKFAYMTYLPILLVSNRGLTPAFAGLTLGAAAILGTLVAAVSGQLVRRIAPSRIVALSLILIALGFALVVVAGASPVLILLASLAYGAADGAYGVLQNAAITQVISPEMRATFVAATGSIRNFGKFLAPSLLGALTLMLPLEASFLGMALLALLSLVTVAPLAQLDGYLSGKETSISLERASTPG